MEYNLSLTYSKNGAGHTICESNDDVTVLNEQTENGIAVKITTKSETRLVEARIDFDYYFKENDLFFANGFQSWTDTREFKKHDTMPDCGFIAKTPFGKKMGLSLVGDYNFTRYKKTSGFFHSDSYAYVNHGDSIEFFGSLNDRTGYTTIEADMNNNHMTIYKDIEGVAVNGEYTLFSLYLDNGIYDEVFDRYFSELNIKPLTDKKIRGYTSWYNYYQNINETVIIRDLEALKNATDLIDTFQIDDGYQVAVGEWLNINKKKFPNGMKPIADAIHKNGLQAGIWLAPFGVQHNSALVKEHPDWIIKNKKGKNIEVGANWGGFYPLDIYNDEVRDYIHHFFDVILNEWGFDLVKLDFLYAAAVIPRNNKSRGEIMYDAMELIRDCVKDKKVLGCGVPMMPCFGKVEYMRIGADMALQWQDSSLRKKMHREDVSTVNAIMNSVYRRHLNGRAFLCDPDVFLLRDYNIKFTFEQRKMLAKFIKIFGSVIFTSDDVGRYTKEQLDCLKDTLSVSGAVLRNVTVNNNICEVNYTEDGKDKTLSFNILNGMPA